MRQRLKRLIGDRRGATAVEYGLILALLTLVVLTGMSNVADVTVSIWDRVSSKVSATNNG